MPKRQRQTTSPRRKLLPSWLKLRYVGVLVVGLWAVCHYFGAQAPELQALQSEHQSLVAQLQHSESQQTTLKHEISNLQSKSYIEKYATEHFNLIVPGQVPFDLAH